MEIVKELSLNKNIQNATNGSLILANNIRFSDDYSFITADRGFSTAFVTSDLFRDSFDSNETLLRNSLKVKIPTRNYTLFLPDISTRGLSYTILGSINCENEVVLFIEQKFVTFDTVTISYIVARAVAIEGFDEFALYFISSAWTYGGGQVFGEYYYNNNNELIVAVGELMEDDNTLVPLKIINLNTCSAVDDESVYSIAPDVPVINAFVSDRPRITIPSGTYQFFIRFAKDNTDDNYTNWFQLGNPVMAYKSEEETLIKGHTGTSSLTYASTVINIKENINKLNDCNNSFAFTVLLSDYKTYTKYQIGYVLQKDGNIVGRIYNSYNINTSSFVFDGKYLKEESTLNFLKPVFNIYNPKAIGKFKNSLIVGNYAETNYNESRTVFEDFINSVRLYYIYEELVPTSPINTTSTVAKQKTSIKGSIKIGLAGSFCDFDILSENIEYNNLYKTITIPLMEFLSADAFISDLDGSNGHTDKIQAELIDGFITTLDDLYVSIGGTDFYSMSDSNISCYAIISTDYPNRSNIVYKIYISDPDPSSDRWETGDVVKFKYGINGTVFTSITGQAVINYTDFIINNDSYNVNNINNDVVIPSFDENEVYSFHIHFVRKDGSYTNGYILENFYGHDIQQDQIISHTNDDPSNPISYADLTNKPLDAYPCRHTTLHIDSNLHKCKFIKFTNSEGVVLFKTGIGGKNTPCKLTLTVNVVADNTLIPEEYEGFFISYEKPERLHCLDGCYATFKPGMNSTEFLVNTNSYDLSLINDTPVYMVALLSDTDTTSSSISYGTSKLIDIENVKVTKSSYFDVTGSYGRESLLSFTLNSDAKTKLGKSANVIFTHYDNDYSAASKTYTVPFIYRLYRISKNVYMSRHNKELIRLTRIYNKVESLKPSQDDPKIEIDNLTYGNYPVYLQYDYKIVIHPSLPNRSFEINGQTSQNKPSGINLVSGIPYFVTKNGELSDKAMFSYTQSANTSNYYYVQLRYFISSPYLHCLKTIKEAPLIVSTNLQQDDNKKAIIAVDRVIPPENLSDLFDYKGWFKDVNFITYYSVNDPVKLTRHSQTIRLSKAYKNEATENSWTNFYADDYINLYRDKGEITNIKAIGKNLLVHTTKGLFTYINDIKLTSTGENESITIASNDDYNLYPTEIVYGDNGYGGIPDFNHAVVTNYSYVWYSPDNKKIFEYVGNKVNIISDDIIDIINNRYYKNCRFNIDNNNNVLYLCLYTIDDEIDCFTISYNLMLKKFVSTLDYLFVFDVHTTSVPIFVSNGTNILDTYVYSKEVQPAIYLDAYQQSPYTKEYASGDEGIAYFDVVFSAEYNKVKCLNSIYWIHDIINIYSNALLYNDKPLFAKKNDIIHYKEDLKNLKLVVYSDICTSGEIPLYDILNSDKTTQIKINGVTRQVSQNITPTSENYKYPWYQKGIWQFNAFRDVTLGGQDSDNKPLIYGKFIAIRFIYKTSEGQNIKFDNIGINSQYY